MGEETLTMPYEEFERKIAQAKLEGKLEVLNYFNHYLNSRIEQLKKLEGEE